MTDLISWLRQQLDTDEADINRHPDGEDDTMFGDLHAEEESNYPCFPYLRINKTFALRQVQAHRAILDDLAAVIEDDEGHNYFSDGHAGLDVAKRTLRLLASIYSDRDGWQEEWSA